MCIEMETAAGPRAGLIVDMLWAFGMGILIGCSIAGAFADRRPAGLRVALIPAGPNESEVPIGNNEPQPS